MVDMPFDQIALVAGLVQIAKGLDPEGKYSKLYPIISICLGIGLSIALTYGEAVSVDSVINGLLYGLSASGFYSAVKKLNSK